MFDSQWLYQAIHNYGCAALFLSLMLGIIGLPVPDELLMTYTGYLVFKGELSMPAALAAAFGGSVCGISVSYGIGRTAGLAVVHYFGRFLRISPNRIAMVHDWFERRGKWALPIGYYVPGVRHVTALVAGASEMAYGHFALFAYAGGAFFWSSSWILLGFFLGPQFHAAEGLIRRNLLLATAVTVAAAAICLLVRRRGGTRKA